MRWAIENAFVCAPDVSGELGAFGDPCENLNVCDPGLACLVADGVPGCAGAVGCCSPYCDLDAPICAHEEQDCIPAYELGHAPWGYEDVGFCMVPV